MGSAETGAGGLPLEPKRTIPLVLVWSKDAVNPAADAFRELVLAWLAAGS